MFKFEILNVCGPVCKDLKEIDDVNHSWEQSIDVILDVAKTIVAYL